MAAWFHFQYHDDNALHICHLAPIRLCAQCLCESDKGKDLKNRY